MIRYLKSAKVLAGLICLGLGVFFAVGYDAADYEPREHRLIRNPHEAAQVMVENDRKERAGNEHRIYIGGFFVFGLLVLGSGIWTVSTHHEPSEFEAAAEELQASSKLVQIADALDDIDD